MFGLNTKKIKSYAWDTFIADSDAMVFFKDANLVYTGASKSFLELIGAKTSKAIIGKTDYELYNQSEAASTYSAEDKAIIEKGIATASYMEPLPSARGRLDFFSVRKYPIKDEKGKNVGILGICYNLSEPKNEEKSSDGVIREYNTKLNLYQNIPPNMLYTFVIDIDDWKIENEFFQNDDIRASFRQKTAAQYLQAAGESVVENEEAKKYFLNLNAKTALRMFNENQKNITLTYLRHLPSGDNHWVRTDIKYITKAVNNHRLMLFSLTDIDKERKSAKNAERTEDRDELTGLLNGEAAVKQITNFLESNRRASGNALFVVNLDNFRFVNEKYGRPKGNEIIVKSAEAVKALFRDTDIIGRIGGDEFIVFMKGIHDLRTVVNKAEDVIAALRFTITDNNETFSLTASAGIYIYTTGTANVDKLIADASTALRQAKNSGGDKFNIYNNIADNTTVGDQFFDSSGGIFKSLTANFKNNITLVGLEDNQVKVLYKTSPTTDDIECILDLRKGINEIETFNLIGGEERKKILQQALELESDSKYLDTFLTPKSNEEVYSEQLKLQVVPIPQDGCRYLACFISDTHSMDNYNRFIAKIIDSMPVGVILIELVHDEMQIIYKNKPAASISDNEQQEHIRTINKNSTNAIHPDDYPYVIESLQKIADDLGTTELYFRNHPNAKNQLFIRAKTIKVGERNGNPLLLTMLLDIVKQQGEHQQSQKLFSAKDKRKYEDTIALLKYNLELGAKRFETFLKKISGGILVMRKGINDEQFQIDYINEGLYKILKMTPEEFQQSAYGINPFNGLHPDDVGSIIELLGNIPSSGHSEATTEYRTLCGDGTYKWVNATGNFDVDNDGNIIAYILYTDIDGQKTSESKMRSNYQKIRKELESLDEITVFSLWLNLTKNSIEDIYAEQVDIHGVQTNTVDEYIASMATRIYSDEQRNEYLTLFNREQLCTAFENGETKFSIEHQFLVENGKNSWIRTTIHITRNPDTYDIEAIMYSIDINATKIIDAMMRQFVDLHYDFLCTIDVNDRIISNVLYSKKYDSIIKASMSYQNEYIPKVKSLISSVFAERFVKEMDLDFVIQGLSETEKYSLTMPIYIKGLTYKTWQFSWLDETKTHIILSCYDTTTEKQLEYDQLTGLYNKKSFILAAQEIIAKSPANSYTLMYIDVDNFKLINERFGREEGDRLLLYLTERIFDVNLHIEGVLSCRGNADVFIMLTPTPYIEIVRDEAASIMENKKGLFPFPINMRVGLLTIDDPNADMNILIDRAMLAQQTLRGQSYKHWVFYEDGMLQTIRQNQELLNDMDKAIAERQFKVYFQPQYNYATGKITGAEALVRWQHPTKGIVSPGIFIPLFEKARLVTALDEYIWEETCQYIHSWIDAGDEVVPIAVNISRIDIYDANLTTKLQQLIEKYNISPELLRLEITESAYMDDSSQLIKTVDKLNACGFTVEIDDFGSGYSSLNTLKDVKVDILKLDMKFIMTDSGNSDERSKAIINSVISMAHLLNMHVIAEGVETKEQADLLQSIGCDYMQGFLFSKPIPSEEFEALMKPNAGQKQ